MRAATAIGFAAIGLCALFVFMASPESSQTLVAEDVTTGESIPTADAELSPPEILFEIPEGDALGVSALQLAAQHTAIALHHSKSSADPAAAQKRQAPAKSVEVPQVERIQVEAVPPPALSDNVAVEVAHEDVPPGATEEGVEESAFPASGSAAPVPSLRIDTPAAQGSALGPPDQPCTCCGKPIAPDPKLGCPMCRCADQPAKLEPAPVLHSVDPGRDNLKAHLESEPDIPPPKPKKPNKHPFGTMPEGGSPRNCMCLPPQACFCKHPNRRADAARSAEMESEKRLKARADEQHNAEQKLYNDELKLQKAKLKARRDYLEAKAKENGIAKNQVDEMENSIHKTILNPTEQNVEDTAAVKSKLVAKSNLQNGMPSTTGAGSAGAFDSAAATDAKHSHHKHGHHSGGYGPFYGGGGYGPFYYGYGGSTGSTMPPVDGAPSTMPAADGAGSATLSADGKPAADGTGSAMPPVDAAGQGSGSSVAEAITKYEEHMYGYGKHANETAAEQSVTKAKAKEEAAVPTTSQTEEAAVPKANQTHLLTAATPTVVEAAATPAAEQALTPEDAVIESQIKDALHDTGSVLKMLTQKAVPAMPVLPNTATVAPKATDEDLREELKERQATLKKALEQTNEAMHAMDVKKQGPKATTVSPQGTPVVVASPSAMPPTLMSTKETMKDAPAAPPDTGDMGVPQHTFQQDPHTVVATPGTQEQPAGSHRYGTWRTSAVAATIGTWI